MPTYLPATRYGGPIRSVHGLCRALAELGHSVDVATTNVDGAGNSDVVLYQPVDIDGVKVRYFPCNIGRRIYWSPAMRRWLKHELNQYDIAHLHSVFLWPTSIAAKMARQNGVPYILSPRGMLVRSLIESKSRLKKRMWIQLVEKRNIEGAEVIHLTSELEWDEMKNLRLKHKKVRVIANGVECSQEERKESTSVNPPDGSTPVLMYLGRISWKKGLDRLLQALTSVNQPYEMWIVGNDDENYRKKLKELGRKLNITNNIRHVDAVDDKQKWVLLRKAAVLILPSYQENFGNVVLEGMACSVPIITTEDVGAARIVGDADAGMVVAGDVAGLGDAINQLLSDPEKRRLMGRNGKSTVDEKYTWPKIAEEMAMVYGEATG